jgi:hypothetical protein
MKTEEYFIHKQIFNKLSKEQKDICIKKAK